MDRAAVHEHRCASPDPVGEQRCLRGDRAGTGDDGRRAGWDESGVDDAHAAPSDRNRQERAATRNNRRICVEFRGVPGVTSRRSAGVLVPRGAYAYPFNADQERGGVAAMGSEVAVKVAAWRALPRLEKVRRRRAAVVDQVVGSMAMEGEPVSAGWIQQARLRQSAAV